MLRCHPKGIKCFPLQRKPTQPNVNQRVARKHLDTTLLHPGRVPPCVHNDIVMIERSRPGSVRVPISELQHVRSDAVRHAA